MENHSQILHERIMKRKEKKQKKNIQVKDREDKTFVKISKK